MQHFGTQSLPKDIVTQEQITELSSRVAALESQTPADWSPLSVLDVAMMAETSQNRLAGHTDVVCEHSTSSGNVDIATWRARTIAEVDRFNLTTGYSAAFYGGTTATATTMRGYYKLRVTLNFGTAITANAKRLIIRYTNTADVTQYMRVEIMTATGDYLTIGTHELAAHTEWFALPFDYAVGGTGVSALRLTFYTDSASSIPVFRINSLRLIAPECSKADPIAMGGVVLRNGDKTATLAVNDNGDIIINGNINLSAALR